MCEHACTNIHETKVEGAEVLGEWLTSISWGPTA